MKGIKYTSLIALALTTLVACTSNQQSKDAATDTAAVKVDTATNTPISIKDEKQQAIYSAYIELKDQLVQTNYETAKPAALGLSQALHGFAGCENASIIADKIAKAKDIKAQRAHFTDLNVELIPVFKHAELTAGTIYVQHCPMANDGNGGDWLSSVKKIENPYYGDEMMECGRVVEEIKSAKTN